MPSLMASCLHLEEQMFRHGWHWRPDVAARMFAEAQRMDALRSSQPERLFPPRASIDRARQLERMFHRRKILAALRVPLAAASLIALGWIANSMTEPLRQDGQTVDENFVLAAREALRVAQLNAGPNLAGEPQQEKIERLIGAINISVPQLPSAWHVTDVQLQPWNHKTAPGHHGGYAQRRANHAGRCADERRGCDPSNSCDRWSYPDSLLAVRRNGVRPDGRNHTR